MSFREEVRDGAVRRGYQVECCDCGLVHIFDFRVVGGRAEFRARRDERRRRARRR